MDTYANIGGPDGKLARLDNFHGNSWHGVMGVDKVYRVVSYSTIIATVDTSDVPFIKEVPDRYYSKTTSRQQNLCRAWLPGDLDPEVARHERKN